MAKTTTKSSVNVKPLADRVLVQAAPAETKTGFLKNKDLIGKLK